MLEDMSTTMRPAIDEFVDRHAQARRAAALRTEAMTDPLTALGNRRALDEAVPVGDYALISLDLDHFKDVNDTYGHAAGDVVLARVAKVLGSTVRGDDGAYRLGGEEFLLCLMDADEERAVAVAERVRSRVSELGFLDQGIDHPITVSIGVTAAHGLARDGFAEALQRADEALYESKETGRDRITVHVDPALAGA
jgi:diguanylate cyclase (GGDEF)-like protein